MKFSSRDSSEAKSSRIKSAADAVLGTGAESSNSLYNIKSGTLLTFAFLFVVGWVPMVGQAIAGFVGGRRTGSPYRAIVSSILAVVMAVAVLIAVAVGIETTCSLLSTTPEKQIADFSATYPVLGQLASGLLDYVYALFGSNGVLEINAIMYLVTIPFAVLGGVVADQTQKEMRIVTNRSIEDAHRTVRSLDLYKQGKKMGFESYEEYSPMSVNSMNTTAHTAAAAAAEAEPAPVVAPIFKEAPVVTSTVDVRRVNAATPTSSLPETESTTTTIYTNDSPFGNILHMSTRKPKASESKNDSSSDGMDFI